MKPFAYKLCDEEHTLQHQWHLSPVNFTAVAELPPFQTGQLHSTRHNGLGSPTRATPERFGHLVIIEVCVLALQGKAGLKQRGQLPRRVKLVREYYSCKARMLRTTGTSFKCADFGTLGLPRTNWQRWITESAFKIIFQGTRQYFERVKGILSAICSTKLVAGVRDIQFCNASVRLPDYDCQHHQSMRQLSIS